MADPDTTPAVYYYFYLLGRRDEEIPTSIDLEQLVDKVIMGLEVRSVANQAAQEAMKAAELDGFKTKWLRDNAQEIEEAGGNKEIAYTLYRLGHTDELATSLEPDLLDALQDFLDANVDMGDAPDEGEEVDDDDSDDDDARDEEPKTS